MSLIITTAKIIKAGKIMKQAKKIIGNKCFIFQFCIKKKKTCKLYVTHNAVLHIIQINMGVQYEVIRIFSSYTHTEVSIGIQMLHFIHTVSLTDKNLLTSARPSQETCCEDSTTNTTILTYYSTTLHSHTSDQTHTQANPSIM